MAIRNWLRRNGSPGSLAGDTVGRDATGNGVPDDEDAPGGPDGQDLPAVITPEPLVGVPVAPEPGLPASSPEPTRYRSEPLPGPAQTGHHHLRDALRAVLNEDDRTQERFYAFFTKLAVIAGVAAVAIIIAVGLMVFVLIRGRAPWWSQVLALFPLASAGVFGVARLVRARRKGQG